MSRNAEAPAAMAGHTHAGVEGTVLSPWPPGPSPVTSVCLVLSLCTGLPP